MEDQRKYGKPDPKWLIKYTDEDLIEAAKAFKHKCDWRRADKNRHGACYRRKAVWKLATAHMTPAWNYYNNCPRVVYACVFPDNHVYIGLTLRPGIRHAQHRSEEHSPAYRHSQKTGLVFEFKILAKNLYRCTEAQFQEIDWHEKYVIEGWTMLNVAKPGSLGWSHPTTWTRELVLESAQAYFTRTEWLYADQPAYKAAVKLGCFEEAVDHMPTASMSQGKRHGEKRSSETKEKMRQAKLGKKLTESHKRAIGLAGKGRSGRPRKTVIYDEPQQDQA